jgi:UPF0755 protein
MGEPVTVTVGKGTSLRQVAEELEKRHVVPSAEALLVWLKLRHLETRVQAGKHTFLENEGMLSAAPKLLVAEKVDVKILIPEGLTIEQTAHQISLQLPIDTAEFARLCGDPAFINSLGVIEPSLEGYLFPDTYRFAPATSPAEIIRRMIGQFEKMYRDVPGSAVTTRLSRHQIVTLASIVEKEATLASEQPHIAGVFHNRLKKGWPLGADPTVRFIYKKYSGPLRVSELQNPSPYNTRVHPGLPPGPICSPGRGAILAAVLPDETEDLYFVARWDGSGSHDFSATNAEHERKKIEIRRLNERRLSARTREKL